LINDREDVKIQRLIILYFIIEDNQKNDRKNSQKVMEETDSKYFFKNKENK
jgi:hypothetical protein